MPAPTSSCVTQTLSCNETIFGTTVGGTTAYSDFSACGDPGVGDFTAPERVFDLPLSSSGGGWNSYAVDVELDSPCADLRPFVIPATDVCPVVDDCTAGGSGAIQTMSLTPTFSGFGSVHYAIVVDGKDGAAANFALKIGCGAGGIMGHEPPPDANVTLAPAE